MSKHLDLLRALAEVLESRNTRWFLFGAQAVVIHGRPRMTADVDITVDLEGEDVRSFVDDMVAGGFDLRAVDVDEFVASIGVLPFLHRSTHMPLDVVLAGPGLEELFFEGVHSVAIEDIKLPVISPEHLIVTKVLAGRPKDIDDAIGVYKAKGESLDLAEIRRLLTLLEEALAQSDLVDVFERIVTNKRKT